MLTDTNKINYIFKKISGKPDTLIDSPLLQEPNVISGNNIQSQRSIISQTQFFRDTIPQIVPSEIANSNTDNEGNSIIGSLVGKSTTSSYLTRYVKLPMHYIPGSQILDSNNNITSISFYLNLLENSIPFTFDPNGSYNYNLYRYDTNTSSYIEIAHNESDWIIDNDTGILTFYTAMNTNVASGQHITKTNPPRISFYKYTGNKGLYPIVFEKNNKVNIKTNVNITGNLDISKNLIVQEDAFINYNLSVKKNLNITSIFFNKLNELPENSSNKLVYASNNLYFKHNDSWLKLGQDDLILCSNEHFIFNHNNQYNILNVNTNISIIEITQNLTSDIYIVLPNIQKTGVEKTIIMGQSISKYINNYNVILYSNYVDVDGNGPIYMNIRFISTGQSLRLFSVVSNTQNIYGHGNKYWQIITGHFHSTDIFQYNNAGELINTNDSGASFQPNVNNIQYESIYSIANNRIAENILINTHYINPHGKNILNASEIILLQFTTNLTQNTTITLNVEQKSGEKKTILVGDSFATYNNGYYVSIASTYMGGYNTDFLTTVSTSNIKFIKSGQHVNLISMKTSNNTYYWHVLTGDFSFI